jgi:hypothetical protein
MQSRRSNRYGDSGRVGETSLGKRKSGRNDKPDPIRRPRESSATSSSRDQDPTSAHLSDDGRNRDSPVEHTSNEGRHARRPPSTRDQEILPRLRRHAPLPSTSNSQHQTKKKKCVFPISHAQCSTLTLLPTMRTDVQVILRPARAIPQCVRPFFNIRAMFLAGFEISMDVNQDPTIQAM